MHPSTFCRLDHRIFFPACKTSSDWLGEPTDYRTGSALSTLASSPARDGSAILSSRHEFPLQVEQAGGALSRTVPALPVMQVYDFPLYAFLSSGTRAQIQVLAEILVACSTIDCNGSCIEEGIMGWRSHNRDKWPYTRQCPPAPNSERIGGSSRAGVRNNSSSTLLRVLNFRLVPFLVLSL